VFTFHGDLYGEAQTAGLDEERHCRAKGSFKIQNASLKDFESDEKNGWGVKTESWDCGDQIGPSSLGHM
jgi:hypothetical protein